MATYLTWNIEGEKQVSRVLNNLKNNLKDTIGPLKEASKNLMDVFSREVFSSQGRAVGESWARLSPYTIAQKARLGYPRAPLVRTGAMQRSFRSLVRTDEAVIYNDVAGDYFKYHQSNKPRRKIPRRVMMKLGNSQKEMVVRVFQAHIRKAL